MQIRRSQLYIGRVLFEDKDLMTIEVAKDENRQLRIEEGDRFLTMVFVRYDKDENSMIVWTPWESDEDSAE